MCGTHFSPASLLRTPPVDQVEEPAEPPPPLPTPQEPQGAEAGAEGGGAGSNTLQLFDRENPSRGHSDDVHRW